MSKKIKFDSIATHITDRAKPALSGDLPYVGLEHLDSDSLKIRRWGHPSDVSGDKLAFTVGDVIFAKRRAYQRKAAVAEFAGICSAHAMVLRAKSDVCLPEFLPFFIQSDVFMKRAEAISVGSLSPTINWKTLAEEEFWVPSLAEQKRLVGVLGKVEAAMEKVETLQAAADKCLASVIATAMKSFETKGSQRLGDCAEVAYGLTVDAKRRISKDEVPYLRVANVQRNHINLTEIKSVGRMKGDDGYQLHAGDILVVEGHADPKEIGRAAMWTDDGTEMLHQNHLIRVRCGDKLRPRYACEVLNSSHGRHYFSARAKSTSGLNTINSSVVKDFSLPIPSLREQDAALAQIAQCHDAVASSQVRGMKMRQMKTMLLQSAFQ